MNEEALARETCAKFLTAAQLKDVCRFRGFGAPPGDKDQLAAYVAARFGGPEGVSEAMRSLDETCLIVLHLIAMSDRPPKLDEIGGILHPDRRVYERDVRGDFNLIATALLNRGVVLVHDTNMVRYSGESRYARLEFILPEAHRPFLPAYPVPSEPLGENRTCSNAPAFLRKALASAIEGAVRPENGRPEGLLQRVAALFSFEKGILTMGGKEPAGADSVLHEARRLWMHPQASKQSRLDAKAADAAGHILSHLPAQHGCTLEALEQGVGRLRRKAGAQELAQFCTDGWEAGFLVRGGGPENPCYAAAPAPAECSEGPPVCSADSQGILVDVGQGGLEGLFELARVSLAEIADGKLRLVPDVVRMGRAGAAWIENSPAIAEARRLCPAYDSPARHVLERQGKLVLHEGLALIRADDLGLRTQLLHRFQGRIRALSGPYLASPRELRDDIESFCRKQGFAPRKLP